MNIVSGTCVAVRLAAGFKQDVPTVWLAEGLLNYLTQEQNEALLHTLHKVCALLLQHQVHASSWRLPGTKHCLFTAQP